MSYELEPISSRRKSFYGKAEVRTEGEKTILRSYTTDVAYIKEGRPVVSSMYSHTTATHIKEFLLQEGFEAVSGKQILKDYAPVEADKETEKEAPAEDNALGGMMKSVAMICAIGKLECKTIKEQNAWDLRMLKASGLPFNWPEDFDSLPEKEKARRLKGVKDIMAEV